MRPAWVLHVNEQRTLFFPHLGSWHDFPKLFRQFGHRRIHCIFNRRLSWYVPAQCWFSIFSTTWKSRHVQISHRRSRNALISAALAIGLLITSDKFKFKYSGAGDVSRLVVNTHVQQVEEFTYHGSPVIIKHYIASQIRKRLTANNKCHSICHFQNIRSGLNSRRTELILGKTLALSYDSLNLWSYFFFKRKCYVALLDPLEL